MAYFRGSEMLVEDLFPGGRGPVSPLFSILERQIREFGPAQELFVGVGPGSYSGIRIGIAAAVGLHLAQSIPACGISSFLGYPGDDYQVVLNARGSWTYASIGEGILMEPPSICSTSELLEKIRADRGVFSPDALEGFSASFAIPTASVLGRRIVAGQFTRLPLQPVYLKPPHITLPNKPPALRDLSEGPEMRPAK